MDGGVSGLNLDLVTVISGIEYPLLPSQVLTDIMLNDVKYSFNSTPKIKDSYLNKFQYPKKICKYYHKFTALAIHKQIVYIIFRILTGSRGFR